MNKPPLTHLKKLSTSIGLYEHALESVPRTEHGYCVDDVTRGLILLCGEADLDHDCEALIEIFLDFVLQAIEPDGTCHNRMNGKGEWAGDACNFDWWGRAVWALGVASVKAPTGIQRSRALEGFHTLTQLTTSELMALTFATLGAGEVLLANPKDLKAERILIAARAKLAPSASKLAWFWPEERLRYSNGSIAQAVLLTGLALHDSQTTDIGIRMLEFLIETETFNDNFSITPVGGRGPGDPKPAFDQQPIEVAAIATACGQAWMITKDPKWLNEICRTWDWFLGSNDVGCVMFDPQTGGGFDGLHASGPNLNQGAESTIAMLTTAQLALELVPAP